MRKLNEVAPDVYCLGNDVFNFYLLREGKEFTLIDAGFPGFWSQLTYTLHRLGGSITDIKAVLITHAHLDHVGLAQRVSEASGAPIYAHPGDRKRIAKGGAQIPPTGLLINAWRRYPFRMLSTAVMNNVFFGPKIKNFIAVEDKQILDVPGKPISIYAPGHTEGSMGYWFKDRKVLFAGDALVTVDLYHGEKISGPQLTSKRTEDDWDQAIASIQRFANLGEVTLLTGHGDPWHGDMNEAILLAEHRAA